MTDFRKDATFGAAADHLESTRNLPKGLLYSLVGVESGGNPAAVSPVGARGLTQFMPATAKQYNINMDDPVDQMRGAADYMQDLIAQYKGNVNAALAHYNGGRYNAQYQIDGTVPDRTRVSAKNFEVNKGYVEKVTKGMQVQPQASAPAQPAATGMTKEQVNSYVTGLAENGASPSVIINQLMRNETTRSLVEQGRAAGDSDDSIVSYLGGKRATELVAARGKVAQQGFVTNVVEGVKSAGKDIAMGTRQFANTVIGDDAALKKNYAEQQAREADPTYRAQQDTAGTAVGSVGTKALPSVAAAVFSGGTSIPAQIAIQAGVGAVSGAMTPRTKDGELAKNIAIDAGVGAAFPIAAKVIGAGTRATGRALVGNDARALLSNEAKSVVEERNMKYVQRAMLKEAGIDGDDITPEIVDAMRKNTYAESSSLLANKTVGNSKTIGAELDDIVTNYRSKVAGPDKKSSVAEYATDLKTKLATGNYPASALVEFRRDIADRAVNKETGITRDALNQITSAIDRQLAASAPEATESLARANANWRRLQIFEKIVEKSNGADTPISPKQLAMVLKATNREAYQAGNAPFQDLSAAALKASPNSKDVGTSLLGTLHSDKADAAALFGTATGNPIALAGIVGRKLASKAIDKIAKSKSVTVSDLMDEEALAKAAKGGKGRIDGATKAFIARALAGSESGAGSGQ